jgi:RND family efflux transporter MFP subunit
MKSFIRKYWKWMAVIVAGIVGITVWQQYSANQRSVASVSTAKVKRGMFIKSISSSGKTKTDKSADLKFQTSGKLAWIGVKEGDTVKAGQVIATLDNREVQKNLEKSLRNYSEQRNAFDETRRFTYGNQQPTDGLDDRLKWVLEKNQWDLEKAVLDVELQHLAVEFSVLTSPISGIITHIDTPVAGVNITPASSVFSVADPGSLVFEANVDETEVGSLNIGQPAEIRLDAFSESTFSGKVSYISYASETSAGGATVFPVKIAFDNPQNLRIGLNGDIDIEVDRQNDVIFMPIEASREDTDGAYVYTKTKTGFTKTRISTGQRNNTSIVVTSGLSNGDTVVTKGFSNLTK